MHHPEEGVLHGFAMGFEFSETCYAAVQPIEQMRQVGLRATPHTETPGGSGHGGIELREHHTAVRLTCLRPAHRRGRAHFGSDRGFVAVNETDTQCTVKIVVVDDLQVFVHGTVRMI